MGALGVHLTGTGMVKELRTRTQHDCRNQGIQTRVEQVLNDLVHSTRIRELLEFKVH